MDAIKADLKYLKDEIIVIRDTVVGIDIGRTSLLTQDDLEDVRQSVDDLKNGPVADISQQLAALKKLIMELQTQVHNGPTTASLRQGMKLEFMDAINSLRKKAPEPQTVESPESGKACVEALVAKTGIIPQNKRNSERMYTIYERLYSGGGLISSVMEYLRFRREVKVMVDFSSDGIGNFKNSITDNDGQEEEGVSVTAYADLKEKVVYVGAFNTSEAWLLPQLAQKMSLLAIGMLFQNGGRPYAEGDAASQSRFGAIVVQAEAKQQAGEELELPITSALGMQGELAKDAYLISVVPWLCAEYGSTVGSSKLTDQLPTLLEYYKDHVVAKLHKESKEEIGL